MKNLMKLSVLAAVFVATATFASADSLTLGSWGSSGANPGVANSALTFNNTSTTPAGITPYAGGAFSGFITQGGLGSPGTGTVDILAPTTGGTWGPALANSFWSSYGQTGPDTAPGSQPGGSYSPDGNYYFKSTFTLTSITSIVGSLNVQADDTVIVFLNGHQENTPTDPGTYPHCSGGVPSCFTSTLVSLNAADFVVGTNTLWFQLVQGGSVDLGLDFNGTVVSGAAPPPTVPEPSTLLMLGAGLVGSAGTLFRRMRRS